MVTLLFAVKSVSKGWVKMWLPTAFLYLVQCALFSEMEAIIVHCYKSKCPFHISFLCPQSIIDIYISGCLWFIAVQDWSSHSSLCFVLSNLSFAVKFTSAGPCSLKALQEKGEKKPCLGMTGKLWKLVCTSPRWQEGCPKGELGLIALLYHDCL